jgi:hypothetical protein
MATPLPEGLLAGGLALPGFPARSIEALCGMLNFPADLPSLSIGSSYEWVSMSVSEISLRTLPVQAHRDNIVIPLSVDSPKAAGSGSSGQRQRCRQQLR